MVHAYLKREVAGSMRPCGDTHVETPMWEHPCGDTHVATPMWQHSDCATTTTTEPLAGK